MVTLKSEAGTDLGLLFVDEVFEKDDISYLLTKSDSTLALTVKSLKPTITDITPSTTEWTNQNVTVTAVFGGSAPLASKQYKVGDGEWSDYVNNVVVTENATVSFKAVDTEGREKTASIAIENIDKVIPTITDITPSTTEWANQNVKVTAVFSDNVEVATKQYKIDNGSWQDYTDKVTVTANATVCFKAVDTAGNEKTESVVIGNIDKVNPTITNIVITPSNLTNTDVSVSADFTDNVAVATKRYKIGSSTWQDYTGSFTVTKNTEVTFEAVDTASNKTEVTYTVSNIDKEKPVMVSVTPDTTEPASVVTLSAYATDNIAVAQYQYRIGSGGNWNDSVTGIFDITVNCTVYVRAIDTATNISDEISIDVRNINTLVVPYGFEVHDQKECLKIDWKGSDICSYRFRYGI